MISKYISLFQVEPNTVDGQDQTLEIILQNLVRKSASIYLCVCRWLLSFVGVLCSNE